ncbi:MAG: hypothetical protein HY815_23785 [Candidatus Riflebacteria bacterium]|nr:hypothetical protein [Candidatus Riflebacteria bacterium]
MHTMRAFVLVLIWLLATWSAAAQVPDPNPQIDILVLEGTDPLTSNWRPSNAADPGEVAAEQTMRRVLANYPEVRRILASAFERMRSFHGAPAADRWKMNENGRLTLLLEMTEAATNGTDHANLKTDPATSEATAFVKKSGGGLVGLTPEQMTKAEHSIADVLVHECDHVKTLFGESDFVARFKPQGALAQDRMWFGGQVVNDHNPFTTSPDPKRALLEGKAMAAQLYFFKAQSFIHPYYEQAFFEGGLWTAYRKLVPWPKRLLLRLAELSKALPGMSRLRAGEWVKQRYGLEGWNDPVLEISADKSAITLKSLEQMSRCEGVVSLVLSDLFESGITNEAVIDKIIAERGSNDLMGLIEDLKGTITEPRVKAQIDAIRSRRLLGADIDFAQARQLWEMRLAGKLTAQDYAKRLDSLIASKLGEQYKQKILLDELPRQPLLAERIVLERPSARIRALLRAVGTNEVFQGQCKFMLAYFVSHYANSLIFGVGSRNPVENMKEALDKMMTKEFVISMGTYMGVMDGAPRLLQWGGKELTARGMNALWPRLARMSGYASRWGGIIGMLVAGVLLRQILANDYSFWKCPNNDTWGFWSKVGMTVKVFFTDLSSWDSKAIGGLIGGAVGFAAVMIVASSCVAGPVGFLGSVAILTVAFIVSYGLGLLGEWIGGLIEDLKYSNLVKSIRWVVDESKKPGVCSDPGFFSWTWLHMDSEDKDAIQKTTTQDGKRTALGRALGTLGDKAKSRYQCDASQPPETVRAVVAGQFKEFFERRDKKLGEVLGKMNEAVAKEKEALDGAEADMRKADPMAGGVDIRKLTLLMCVDTSGNMLAAAEIATGIAVGVLSDPELRKQVGISNIDDDAAVDSLHSRYQGEIDGILKSMTKRQLLDEHEKVLSKYEEEMKRASKRYEEAFKEWTQRVRERTGQHLKKLKEVVGEEMADVTSCGLTALSDKAGPLIEFIDKRMEAFKQLLQMYDEIMTGNQAATTAGQ